jgi:hypothetical protein
MVTPLFLLSESSKCGIHGTKPHQQPLSSWQANFDLGNSNLPPSEEVVKYYALSRITGRVLS